MNCIIKDVDVEAIKLFGSVYTQRNLVHKKLTTIKVKNNGESGSILYVPGYSKFYEKFSFGMDIFGKNYMAAERIKKIVSNELAYLEKAILSDPKEVKKEYEELLLGIRCIKERYQNSNSYKDFGDVVDRFERIFQQKFGSFKTDQISKYEITLDTEEVNGVSQ